MLRAVVDTNIIVSGTISSSGSPYEVLEAWRLRKFTLITSPLITKEVERVFNYPKIKEAYRLDTKTIKAILARLNKYSVLTQGKLKVTEIKEDPPDNMFLACAKEGAADFIVTGDDHLLDLRSFQGIPIVTPRHFLEILKERMG
ncbi:MAG: putative toxin-antitoxin system toxin component, PIN family [Candidatus Aenigmarchaeota archaeon]|nr:putative toxin-antitoxin system toxin component, PIN family [Candidatus Aenigmarchaeota archaeon]